MQQMNEVIVDNLTTVHEGGRKCQPFDYFSVKYKAWQGDTQV